MDTTRENVERWIAEHAKPHITRDYRPTDEARDMLRALTAERDTLKALCVGLVEAGTNAITAGICDYNMTVQLSELLTRARSVLK